MAFPSIWRLRIYKEYGPAMYTILQNNPYKLADDIPGVGFKMADEIAAKIGIVADSDFRIKSGILYTLYQATANGHTYLPEDELADRAAKLLQVEISEIDKHLMDMQMDKRLVIREEEKAENSRNGSFSFRRNRQCRGRCSRSQMFWVNRMHQMYQI